MCSGRMGLRGNPLSPSMQCITPECGIKYRASEMTDTFTPGYRIR